MANRDENDSKIRFVDYFDIDYQIMSQIQIEYYDTLDFCCLFECVIDEISPLNKKITYLFRRSTIGESDNSFIPLLEGVEKLLANEKMKFNQTFTKIEIAYNKLPKNLKTIILKEPVKFKMKFKTANSFKTFNYNMLNICPLAKYKYIIILGQYIQNINANQINHLSKFFKELNEAYKNIISEKHDIDKSMLYLKDKSSIIFGHILRSYKQFLSEDIDKLHLFLYNAFDRRVYYQHIDANIDEDDIKNYIDYCSKFKIDLSLTEKQKEYIRLQINRRYNLDEDESEFIEQILNNISNLSWIMNFYSKTLERNKRIQLLKIFFTCIPQEPWTGVAGYTSCTWVPDISNIKTPNTRERRWDPKNINSSYFYQKLTAYEILLGVAGEGSMFAFPIMECGQISGVLFVTRKKHQKFKNRKKNKRIERSNKLSNVKDIAENINTISEEAFDRSALRHILNLVMVLKNTIMFRRQFDFVNSVLEKLVYHARDYEDPIQIIVEQMPYLFNITLALVWRPNTGSVENTIKPKYLYGFFKDPKQIEDRNDPSLIPQGYGITEESNRIWQHFHPKNSYYKNIMKISSQYQNIALFDVNDFDETLPLALYHHKPRGEVNVTDNLQSIKSGIIIPYKEKTDEAYIVLYTVEPLEMLKKQLSFIEYKIEIIKHLVKYEFQIFQIFARNRVQIHQIRGGAIDALDSFLDRSYLSLMNLINQYPNVNVKEEIQKNITYIFYSKKALFTPLIDVISRIDPGIYTKDRDKLEPCNLFDIITNVCEQMKTFWASVNPDSIYYKSLINSENIFDIKTKLSKNELIIYANEDLIYQAMFNIIENIYRPSVIPLDIINTQPKRVITLIKLYKHNDDCLALEIKDKGLGMSQEVIKWIRKVFEEVKEKELFRNLNDDSRYILNPDLHNSYNKLKNSNSSSNGFGIFHIARSVYSTWHDRFISFTKRNQMIRVTSREGHGTKFLLLFPLNKKEGDYVKI